VSDFKAAENIIQTAVKSFGRIDILVNNAASSATARSQVSEGTSTPCPPCTPRAASTASPRDPADAGPELRGHINITSSAVLRGNFGQATTAQRRPV
jgi:NAD(P)-dependent dehydrogenase (short-subunit alcohol dehydrogenase family)